MKKIVLLALMCLAPIVALASENQGYIAGHITTCSAFVNGYPSDTTNWFFRAQHKVIQYWAYFLFPSGSELTAVKNREYLFVNPFEYYSGKGEIKDSNSYVFENKWISPTGKVVAEKTFTWDKTSSADKVTIEDKVYVPYAFINYIGITQMFKENGQDKLPDEQGLYHINLYINGELAAVTFFEMKD
ncbi:MAG: hypothetical protein WCJ94_04590 [bacterium]